MSAIASELQTYDRLFIDNEWVEPVQGGWIESIDPSSGHPWARIADGTEADVDAAVAAARAALVSPAWRGLTGGQRAALMRTLAHHVEQHVDELALIESRDNGMTLADARNDVGALVNWLNFFSGAADKISGQTIATKPEWHSYTVRQPVGVVGAIIPWNGPILMLAWKLGPLLAAGCTVVIKPAEQTPATALEFAKLVKAAGFPPGVVNVVTGAGETVGHRLVVHPGVDKIAFTGSHLTAQHILREAASTMKRVSAECGGKAPHVIFADAPLEKAMDAAAAAVFRRTGQSCALGSRVLVERAIYDDVVAGLADRAAHVRVGNPLHADTVMGPHTMVEQLEKTLSYVEIGQQEGARLVYGGGRPSGAEYGDGLYVQPTVFADVRNDMRIAQEEIFGPVASVIPFDSEEEAIELANDIIYGLTAGLWTRDVGRAHRVAGHIDAGLVSVNVYPAVHWAMPYGGMKYSGLGRENGVEALDIYTETKSVVVDLAASA